jgi:hypothetical protein
MEEVDVRTSAGVYWVYYWDAGRYQGQKKANYFTAGPETGANDREAVPNNIHWECINYVLRRWVPHTGDTLVISMTPAGGNYSTFNFVCEFTSATQYKYWFFEHLRRAYEY